MAKDDDGVKPASPDQKNLTCSKQVRRPNERKKKYMVKETSDTVKNLGKLQFSLITKRV